MKSERTITPRENFIRFFKGEPTEWQPTSVDMKPFLPEIIPENIARGMVMQQSPFPKEKFGGRGMFNVDWVFEPEAGGSIETAPLYNDLEALEEWENKFEFPDLDSYDWEGCAAANREYLDTDKLISTTVFTSFFERLISFIGFENAAMALLDEDCREHVRALFDKLADFYIDYVTRLHKHFNVGYFDIHDNWGTQRSPMFSPAVHREMIVPCMRKLVQGAHKAGLIVELHSCGFIEPLIPGVIETGIDTWRGQAVNDKLKLVNQYGDKFKFGVEVRPAGPVSDEEAIEFARALKKDYEGKNVWYFFARTLTPAQKNLLATEVF